MPFSTYRPVAVRKYDNRHQMWCSELEPVSCFISAIGYGLLGLSEQSHNPVISAALLGCALIKFVDVSVSSVYGITADKAAKTNLAKVLAINTFIPASVITARVVNDFSQTTLYKRQLA